MHSKISNPKQEHSIEFESLGTYWHISSRQRLASEVTHDIHLCLDEIDRMWSRFREDSVVAEMAKSAGTYHLDARDYQLLRWYEQLYTATDGRVTPLIAQTLSDSGYDKHYSFHQRATLSPTPRWEDILSLHESSLTLSEPALLDVGAAGKGFAVDRIADVLSAHHIDEYLIDAGGDIRTRSDTAHVIGLEHPSDPDSIIATYELRDKSICGSAGNRRTWGDWHHILDPLTSRPTRDIIATWAIAESSMVADGLATALFFVHPDRLRMLAAFDYIIVHKEGTITYSEHKELSLC